jgi:hypothetical protein
MRGEQMAREMFLRIIRINLVKSFLFITPKMPSINSWHWGREDEGE